jgi:predicted transcriptional regulator
MPTLDPAYQKTMRLVWRPQGASVKEILEVVEVDKSSVYRYLKALKERYPIERVTKRGESPRYRFVQG